VLTLETVAAIVERIQKPRAPKKEALAPAVAADPGELPDVPVNAPQGYSDQPAAYDQSQPGEPMPLDADSLGFAFEDEPQAPVTPPKPPPAGAAKRPSRRGGYFSPGQWIVLGVLFLLFVLLLAAIIILAVMNA
jgi:hypothetical protein